MADTIGSLIDKLATCTQKMFAAQENLYSVRRMSFEEFKANFGSNDEQLRTIYDFFKKSCDLNAQRQSIILEIDKKIVEVISAAVKGEDLDNGTFVQDQHKTY